MNANYIKSYKWGLMVFLPLGESEKSKWEEFCLYGHRQARSEGILIP